MVSLQKQNGVRLIKGKESDRDCSEFTTKIAAAIKEEICEILATKTAFSILSDGSQPKRN